MEQEKKQPKKVKLTTVIIILIVLIASAGFLGYSGYNYYTDRESALDSIIVASERKIDSVIALNEDIMIFADEIREENDQFRTRNRNLIYALRNAQERALSFRDTVFISNARYIARSSDRYYSENDTLR